MKNISLHSLRVYLYPGSVSDLSDRVELALESRVEKLKLYHSELYRLPRQVYTSTSLTTLKLEQCVLDQPLSAFRSIKKLILLDCHITNDPIVLNCPALQALTIDKCYGFRAIRIPNLVRLQTVVIVLTTAVIVDIATPIVQKVSFQGYQGRIWSNVDNDGCYCLKVLKLQSKKIKDQECHGLLSKLPLLEDLYVVNCKQLEAMKVSNRLLKTLLVSPCAYSCLKSIDIAAPALKNFMFLGHTWSIRPTKIKIKVQADYLETLVLYSAIIRSKKFDKLIATFPQLRNLFIFRCNELKKIKIPNSRLRRLHIAGCCDLKAVKVDSHELFELHCVRIWKFQYPILIECTQLEI